jgi:hypothetical protein
MRFVAALMVILGCSASGGGDAIDRATDSAVDAADAVTDSTTSVDTAKPTGDAIFPTEDGAMAETKEDTTPCGTVGLACCGTTCSVGYCYMGKCLAKPTVTEEGGEASVPEACADLGITHAAPAFLYRYTITGRPGAKANRWAKKVSCVGATAAITPESPLTIGASGTVTFTIDNTASAVCTDGNIGRYETWVEVDGVDSDHRFGTFFNSKCAQTCASAATICPG